MDPFSQILGQDVALETLRRSMAAGRPHHAYRFEGPPGVGKRLAAFALATQLICGDGDSDTCQQCRRRVNTNHDGVPSVPLHPDVIMIERGLYPPETIGRSRPELKEISVDQIRNRVIAHAAFPPHEGNARVFIIRAAEELSISAANALLKTLEEPSARTHFILLTSKRERLLPTILSRTLPIRFRPLADEVLSEILSQHKIAQGAHAQAIGLAGGSASLALQLANGEGLDDRAVFVNKIHEAVEAPTMANAVVLGESMDRDRKQMAEHLRALCTDIARRGRMDAVSGSASAERHAAAFDLVAEAIRNVEANASASLTIMWLVSSMRRLRPVGRDGSSAAPSGA